MFRTKPTPCLIRQTKTPGVIIGREFMSQDYELYYLVRELFSPVVHYLTKEEIDLRVRLNYLEGERG